MEEFKVLITTSGLGSRLGNLTDYTNKCLVRVGDKPVISHIIESYPEWIEFVITLGHYGSHVEQFLKIAYPDKKFKFITVDKYKGDGSSLGYSILQAKSELQCPFIFHASDTIIDKYISTVPDHNYVIGTYREDSSQYRTLNLDSGKLIRINEKGELHFDFSYVGIAGIKDYELFFSEMETLVNDRGGDISDVHAINNMLSNVDFLYHEAGYGNWYDIGNTSELFKTRKAFKNDIDILDKKDESIFFFKDSVIKFFADSTINNNRVIRAKQLTGLVPEIESSSENFYKYRKAEGSLFSKSVNSHSFHNFLGWSKRNLWIPKKDDGFKELCYDFYINKTKKRIDQYLRENGEVQQINGTYVPTAYDLLNSIDSNWLCNGIPSQFHGDFILDNIIQTDSSFCLIDWRQDFGGNLEIGDLYYDLAKLNHNLTINHDIVNRNLFSSKADNCFILINSTLNECQEILHKFIDTNGYDLRKVKILTSLIWINMSPLHDYPFNNFLFNFGKYNLYKTLNHG